MNRNSIFTFAYAFALTTTAGLAACGTDTGPDPVDPGPDPGPAERSALEGCIAGGGALAERWATENFHGAISAIAMSGAAIVVASEDGSVKQWRAGAPESPSYGTTFHDEGPAVTALAIGGDGHVVGGDALGRLREWRLADASPMRTTPVTAAAPAAVAVSGDGARAAIGGATEIRVVDRATAAASAPLETALWGVDALAFGAGDLLVTAGHWYGTPMIERRDARAPLAAIDAWNDQAMGGHVRAVAADRLGARVLAGGDGFVAVFDAADLAAGPLAITTDPAHQVVGLVLLSGGELFATAGAEGTIRLWDAATAAPAGTVTLATTPVGLAAEPAGELLATAGPDGVVRAVACRP